MTAETPDPAYAYQMFPTPWHVEHHVGTNRAYIYDAQGGHIFAGMNVYKARVIVAAVNRDAERLASDKR